MKFMAFKTNFAFDAAATSIHSSSIKSINQFLYIIEHFYYFDFALDK